MSTETLETHEAASEFPMMSEERYKALRDDIGVNGLREPIVLLDGKILDGRNRYKACLELGIKARTKTFSGDPFWADAQIVSDRKLDIAGTDIIV